MKGDRNMENMESMNKLKELRQDRGWNQEVLAKMLNMSRNTYINKENGITQFTLREASKIASLFQRSIDELFFEYELEAVSP